MEKQDELRAYFFQNMYLTGVQAGIQSQHTTVEMFLKYDYHPGPGAMLYDWACNHKTTIVLNGGHTSDLWRIHGLLKDKDNPYPWAHFCESEEALQGCITNVGIILPGRVYDYKNQLIEKLGFGLTDWEVELVEVMSKCKLMN